MLDIKILRNEPEKIKEALKKRNNDLDISPAIELDAKRRALLADVEAKKASQNEITKKIPAMKKAGENTDTIFAGVTDKETGFVEEQIDNGMYGLFVSRPGYIDFNDTLFNVISDTLYVDLQPIKKNTVAVLFLIPSIFSNIFFPFHHN